MSLMDYSGATAGWGPDQDVQDSDGSQQAKPFDSLWHHLSYGGWGKNITLKEGFNFSSSFPGFRILLSVCGKALPDRTLAGEPVLLYWAIFRMMHFNALFHWVFFRTLKQALLPRHLRLASKPCIEIYNFTFLNCSVKVTEFADGHWNWVLQVPYTL